MAGSTVSPPLTCAIGARDVAASPGQHHRGDAQEDQRGEGGRRSCADRDPANIPGRARCGIETQAEMVNWMTNTSALDAMAGGVLSFSKDAVEGLLITPGHAEIVAAAALLAAFKALADSGVHLQWSGASLPGARNGKTIVVDCGEFADSILRSIL